MKNIGRTITVLAMVALGGLMLGSVGCGKSEPEQKQSGGETHQYTCSMHPDVVQDKPGKCPKCGMVLVEKH